MNTFTVSSDWELRGRSSGFARLETGASKAQDERLSFDYVPPWLVAMDTI
ncbi:MAG: hypothetical protein WCP01_02190 [Methylococcaceae bacterium]